MPLLPSVFTVMVPATVCLPPLCVSVWMHACKRVMAHMHTVALFARRFCSLHPLPAQTVPNYHFSCFPCVSPEGSLWVCVCARVCVCVCVCVCVWVKHRGASGLCLLDIGGPCTPMKLWDKDCCLCGHKSSLSLAFTLSLLSVLPLFSHSPCWPLNGVRVRAGVRADTSPCPWPLAPIQTAHDY